jgi:hypothetical protein
MTDAEIKTRLWSMSPEQLGAFGEKVWGNVMLGADVDYVPLCELPPQNGKGPRMRGCDTVLPDFDATGRRRRFYLDSKCKKNFVIYRNAGGEPRHGIDGKYWRAYSAISNKNTQKCLLGLLELFGDCEHGSRHWQGSLLAQSLGTLGTPAEQHGKTTREYQGMVFWPRAKFRTLAVYVPPAELVRMSKEPVLWRHDIAAELLSVVAEPEWIQPGLFK